MILDIAHEMLEIIELARECERKAEQVNLKASRLLAKLDKELNKSVVSMGLPEGVTYKDCNAANGHGPHLHGGGKLWCNGHKFDRT